MAAPDAINDAIIVNENVVFDGNVLLNNGNGADNDPDGDTLTVTAVNGEVANVGNPTTLASGALLTLFGDGSFDYDPTRAFRALNDGETGNDSFTYTIDDGNGGTDTATVTVTINGITSPVNDDFADAVVLSGLTATASGSNVAATGEVGEPAQFGSINSVWWTWTAPSTGEFSLDTLGSDYDTVLSVFTGDAVDNLTLIGQNDQAFGDLSQLTFNAVADTTYAFAVNGFSSDQGNTVLTLGAPDAPRAIDDFLGTDVGQVLSGNILEDNGNGPDVSLDGSALTVSQVNGVASDVGMPITLASGALLTVNADGTYTYDPNDQFDFLAGDETGTDSFTYTVDNGSSTATATATVNIFGFSPSVATPVGPELQVNTFTTEGQDDGEIAVDANGNFIVVWESLDQVSDGSLEDIFAQRYNADGTPNGSEFQINTSTTNSQLDARVAFDPTGGFVVTWGSFGQDTVDSDGIYARRYNADGTPNGGEFQVNTVTAENQEDPTVAVASDGSFIITWESFGQDGDDRGIFAQRYNADGTPNGSEFQVNTVTPEDQEKPAIAIDPSGNVIIAWESLGQDGEGEGIFAQRYNADGTPNGSEFQVNTFTPGNQDTPTVAVDAAGNFVIAWESGGQDGNGDGIFAQRYNADGTPNGSEFQVNAFTPGAQDDPQAAVDTDGNVIITWESPNQDGSSTGVFARRYLADGTIDGGEFQVNTFTTGNQDDPAIATTPTGDFIVAWESSEQDGDGNGVYAQQFAIGDRVKGQPATIFVSSTNTVVGNAFQAGETYAGNLFSNTDLAFSATNDPDDIITGTDDADNIWAGTDGSDIIDSGGGNDNIGFGNGDACVHAGPGDDFVYALGAGGGTNIIELDSGTDNFWAQAGNNTITGTDDNTIGIGIGNDTVTTTGDGIDFVYSVNGGGGTNELNLGDGNNIVWVEQGDYTITTGTGNDEINLGNGTDTVDAGDGDNIIFMADPSGTTDGVKDILTGSGTDFIQTGSGDDLIDAGAGLNTIFGANGVDTVTIRSGAFNFLGDFTLGTDLMQLDNLTFGELSFFAGSGDTAGDAFIFVGSEAIAQVADITVAELENSANFV